MSEHADQVTLRFTNRHGITLMVVDAKEKEVYDVPQGTKRIHIETIEQVRLEP